MQTHATGTIPEHARRRFPRTSSHHVHRKLGWLSRRVVVAHLASGTKTGVRVGLHDNTACSTSTNGSLSFAHTFAPHTRSPPTHTHTLPPPPRPRMSFLPRAPKAGSGSRWERSSLTWDPNSWLSWNPTYSCWLWMRRDVSGLSALLQHSRCRSRYCTYPDVHERQHGIPRLAMVALQSTSSRHRGAHLVSESEPTAQLRATSRTIVAQQPWIV